MKRYEPKIKRQPIQLNNHAVAVIHIFNRTDYLEDIWMSEVDEYTEDSCNQHELAAKQFVEQLEDWWTPKFMKALKNEIEIRLKNQEEL